jgi:hypothetical protein
MEHERVGLIPQGPMPPRAKLLAIKALVEDATNSRRVNAKDFFLEFMSAELPRIARFRTVSVGHYFACRVGWVINLMYRSYNFGASELAVETVPAIALFFRVQQRELSALDNGDIGAPRDFQQPQCALGFFFYPLVSADGSDAKHIEFIRLQKNQNGPHVGRGRTARILIHDHFNLLGVQLIPPAKQRAE